MSDENPSSELHAFIDPALEARIVAWVLGEASAFEATELDRLCGEQPELAIFKRRIEAVHGLTGKAVRPEMQPLRLAPERREKLLQTIGATAPVTNAPTVATPRPRPSLPGWLIRTYGLAASVVLLLCLGLLALPRVTTVREYSRQTGAEMDAREERQRVMIEESERQKAMRDATDDKRRMEVERTANEERFSQTKQLEGRDATDQLRERPAAKARAAATPPPPSGSQDLPTFPIRGAGAATAAAEEEKIILSPFVVEARQDSDSYRATATLAGSRFRTELKDVGSSVSVVTRQFLEDTNASNNETLLVYTTGTEVGGNKKGFLGFGHHAPLDAVTPWTAPSESNRGESFRENVAPGAPVFSPFATASDRDKTGAFKAPAEGDLASLDIDGQIVGQERVRGLIAADNFRKLDGSSLAAKPAQLREKNEAAAAPDETATATEPFSTFSLHVSDVSFRLAQAALARGELPDPARIRPEEFYNAFDYGDPAPSVDEKIACRIEQAAHPVLQQRNLVRIALRVPATGRGAGQPLRLTVLLDTSGSMEREDRTASVRRAMEVLASLLGPNDRVTLIGFARQPRLLVEALPGDQAAKLRDFVAQTPAEGGTNLEAALQLALTKAQQHFTAEAQNRVVLITDGAANLGDANPERLATMITHARQEGLAFDACGVGTNGLDDTILEALTRQGDGRYYVLDGPEDADAGFARQLAGAFRPAAQNVKLQVRFNPARVAHYRLIGFEQHRLRTEDFRNDQVDAAELAAEEAAVAVYQVEVLPGGEGELGDVFVRFRDTAANAMVERSWTMAFEPRARAFDRASPTLQLAGTAALLAEKLHGGAMADLVRLDELAPVVNTLRGRFARDARVQEFVTMFDQARRLAGE